MLNKKRFIDALELGLGKGFKNWGEGFELAMVIAHDTTRYYPTNPLTKSGDIVVMGTHYQIKGHRGFFGNVKNMEELENHLFNECAADRYLLRVGGKQKFAWVNVSKEEVLKLAEAGHIKFEDSQSKNGHVARWTISEKNALHLEMLTGIKVHKMEI